jgi:hypothetical protein
MRQSYDVFRPRLGVYLQEEYFCNLSSNDDVTGALQGANNDDAIYVLCRILMIAPIGAYNIKPIYVSYIDNNMQIIESSLTYIPMLPISDEFIFV